VPIRKSRLILLILPCLLLLPACDDDDDDHPLIPQGDGPYVGSKVCAGCHGEIHADYQKSGHHQHVREVVNGQAPDWAWADQIEHPVPGPPDELTWDDVLMVLGSPAPSTVFVGTDGYLMTGPSAMWDGDQGLWGAYRPGETVPFDCGSCHGTGHLPDEEHDGPEGLVGTWIESGVGCEVCHGPGREHARSEDDDEIIRGRSNAFCNGCHQVQVDHPHLSVVTEVRDFDHFGVDCHTESKGFGAGRVHG